MSSLDSSELILNPDGSVYHLNLLPGDLAPWIITVGDLDRVPEVSKHFDSITLKKGKREFLTHTGTLGKKRISVISTGIGTDNIDIVLNELDALVNFDFESRRPKDKKIRLSIVRIGTSGSIQAHVPVDSLVLGNSALGLDGLLHFYRSEAYRNTALERAIGEYLELLGQPFSPYAVDCDGDLAKVFQSEHMYQGITVTSPGFYGPQGRMLRLAPSRIDLTKLTSFSFNGMQLCNLEMETAGIYGLARLLGHRAVSLNAILANRVKGEFSKNPAKTVETLIEYALDRISSDQGV